MKKRTVALLLALMLVFGCAVGGTVAWLTNKTTTVTNTFTTGNVKITLDELDIDNSTDGAERDTANEYKLLPGGEYDKDPTVHVSTTSEDCYVYVAVKNGLDGIEGDTTIAAQMTANGWVQLEVNDAPVVLSTGTVWYFAGTAAAGSLNAGLTASVEAGTNLVVFEEITISGTADVSDITSATVDITAYAIQSENMTDVTSAWTEGAAADWT